MHRAGHVGLAVLIATLATGYVQAERGADGHALRARLRGPRVAAHRGGYGNPDENTVERFELARRHGVDVVETDLHVSKDGVVFLFHDARLERATLCTGRFADRTAAEIERCALRGLARGPDRFEDALRWSRGRVVIDAEFKTVRAIEPAIDLVRRYDAYDWVYFQVGPRSRAYERVRAYDRRVAVEASPRGPDGKRWLAELLATRDPHLVSIQLHLDLLSDELVDEVRAAGKLASLNAWRLAPETDDASCAAVFAHGIDIAVTDAPESCVRQREALRTRSAR
jgi:glycerophosphoryl diester phosphodiesterase